MATQAVFPRASLAAGMYESFYLRAVSPLRPLGIWIRYTIHKRPGAPAGGSIWFTLFDGGRAPVQRKLTTPDVSVPEGGWIAVGEASFGASGAEGSCEDVRWSLRSRSAEPELRHLAPALLYRAPLPRTKLTSPAPLATFAGTVFIDGHEPIEIDGWHGMTGHNWGSEHAERWIWLHGVDFAGRPDAWIDVGIGRVRVGGRPTPWVANGAVSLDGRRHRIGGLLARGSAVEEEPTHCRLRLTGASGLLLEGIARAPEGATAGWAYADPDGSGHDVANCSIAQLELSATLPGSAGPIKLASSHGGAYELGMREHDHGVLLAPYSDG
jgi:hypothetical protein